MSSSDRCFAVLCLFLSTSKKKSSIVPHYEILTIFFYIFYMKVRKLELADCGGFVRFETGKMLNLLNYTIAVYYGRIDNFKVLE